MDSRIVTFLILVVAAIFSFVAIDNSAAITTLLPVDVAFILLFIFPVLLFAVDLFEVAPMMRNPDLSEPDADIIESSFIGFCFLVMFVLMVGISREFFSSALPGILAGGMVPLLLFLVLLSFAAGIASFKQSMQAVRTEGRLSSRPIKVLILISFLAIAYLVGSNSGDLFSSVKATVLVFLLYPSAISILALVIRLFRSSTGDYEREAFWLPLAYLIFAAIGAVLGGASQILASAL